MLEASTVRRVTFCMYSDDSGLYKVKADKEVSEMKETCLCVSADGDFVDWEGLQAVLWAHTSASNLKRCTIEASKSHELLYGCQRCGAVEARWGAVVALQVHSMFCVVLTDTTDTCTLQQKVCSELKYVWLVSGESLAQARIFWCIPQ